MLDVDIVYPTSDGKPMGETDAHREQIISLIKALEYHYAKEPLVYVSGNLLMLYEEGNKRKHRSPDVMVAKGVEKRERENYKIWEEGKAPDVVFEITSRSTRTEDLGEKMGLYALLGITEYVIFDPLEEYLEPRLRLFRLAGDSYQAVQGEPFLMSTLGLELCLEAGHLRLREPLSGKLLLTPEERAEQEAERAEQEAERAERESERARLAEAELAELKRKYGLES